MGTRPPAPSSNWLPIAVVVGALVLLSGAFLLSRSSDEPEQPPVVKQDEEPVDSELAEMKRRAEEGDVDAMFALASAHERKGEWTRAADSYREAALRGHSQSMVNLGKMYLTGRGVEESESMARTWFHKAKRKGNTEAETQLRLLSERKKTKEVRRRKRRAPR